MKYEHRYKHGKQTRLLTHAKFCEAVLKAKLELEYEAFLWLLYYSGARKSEAYELTLDKCSYDGDYFTVDFGERKKHGAKVDPLEFPDSWLGVGKLVEWWRIRRTANRKTAKFLYRQEETEETRVTEKGKTVTVKRRVKEKVRAEWLFPHVASTTAWAIIKKVLGPEFYPQFLRLNRLSEIGSDPESNIIRLKSWSGIKSIRALESYMGTSKREQDAARDFLSKRFSKA